MNLKNAYNYIISLSGRSMTLYNKDESKNISLKVARSNYFRNFQGFEETVYEGYEYVISIDSLSEFGTPERGDYFVDEALGNLTIDTIKPDIILGEIVGYRIRTN